MEFKQRKTVFDDLEKYCVLAKKDDFIEVTEWTNGEGYDICFKDKNISLSFGELEAVNYLVKSLEYSDKCQLKNTLEIG